MEDMSWYYVSFSRLRGVSYGMVDGASLGLGLESERRVLPCSGPPFSAPEERAAGS